MQKNKAKKKELTFTFLNTPSEKAKRFHAEFMYRMYLEGKIPECDAEKDQIKSAVNSENGKKTL